MDNKPLAERLREKAHYFSCIRDYGTFTLLTEAADALEAQRALMREVNQCVADAEGVGADHWCSSETSAEWREAIK